MEHYTCIIIDDEQDAIDCLATLIKENCQNLKIVATATSSEEAIKKYFQKLPDLLFLDIEVDEKNGFEILNEIYRDKLKPYTVFVAAFNRFAIDAFKANALDYLMKPCNPEDLKSAVQKFIYAKEKDLQYSRIQALLAGKKQKIRFNTRTGFILLGFDEILYCEADRNYTKIFLTPENYQIVSINLAEVEKKLSASGFWRISRSTLANPEFITEINRKQKKVVLNWQNLIINLVASSDMLKKI
jgi:two-component system, LytTR family, response regulator